MPIASASRRSATTCSRAFDDFGPVRLRRAARSASRSRSAWIRSPGGPTPCAAVSSSWPSSRSRSSRSRSRRGPPNPTRWTKTHGPLDLRPAAGVGRRPAIPDPRVPAHGIGHPATRRRRRPASASTAPQATPCRGRRADFLGFASTDGACSGTVITDHSRDVSLVLDGRALCLSARAEPWTDWLFVPGLALGEIPDSESSAHGCWTPRALLVEQAFVSTARSTARQSPTTSGSP